MDFDTIYQTYHQKIYRLCMGYVNDEELAKDMVQETFIAIWKNLSNFRKESALGTWVYRIAVNNCLRQLDRKKKADSHIKSLNVPDIVFETVPDQPNDKIVFLRKCIAELKEIDRIIISMVLEEVPQKEIGEVLGMTEGNVRVKVHRIKEKINKKFKAYK